jgi:hypothetical protein
MHFVHTSNAISWASLIYYADLASQSAAIIALDTFSVNIRIQFHVLRTLGSLRYLAFLALPCVALRYLALPCVTFGALCYFALPCITLRYLRYLALHGVTLRCVLVP